LAVADSEGCIEIQDLEAQKGKQPKEISRKCLNFRLF